MMRFISLTLALLVVPFQRALAHPRLVTTVPTADSHAAAPQSLLLTFNEALIPALCRLALFDAAMQPVALGSVHLSAGTTSTLTAAVRDSLAAGRYTVEWQAVGDDGHPVHGSYSFDVDARAAPAVRTTHPAPQMTERFSIDSPAYVALRAFQSGALVVILGVLSLHFVIGPRLRRRASTSVAEVIEAAEAPARRWVIGAYTLLLAVTVGRAVAQYAAVFDAGAATRASVAALLFHSMWGSGWWLALAATLLGLIAAFQLRRSPRASWAAVLIAALGVAVSMALSGHAAAASVFAMGVHVLHIAGAGGWIGSLSALAVIAIPVVLRTDEYRRHTLVADLIGAFSPVALISAGVLTATGVLAAWRNLSTVSALWQARYGQVLLGKLALLAVAVLIGAYNWRFVQPTLGTKLATARLQRSATIELCAALLVLIVTAVLVATPLPAELTDVLHK